jgi:hypothetical protein
MNDSEQCCICLDALNEIILECKHSFCKNCIMTNEHILRIDICPLCREKININYLLKQIRKNLEKYLLHESELDVILDQISLEKKEDNRYAYIKPLMIYSGRMNIEEYRKLVLSSKSYDLIINF